MVVVEAHTHTHTHTYTRTHKTVLWKKNDGINDKKVFFFISRTYLCLTQLSLYFSRHIEAHLAGPLCLTDCVILYLEKKATFFFLVLSVHVLFISWNTTFKVKKRKRKKTKGIFKHATLKVRLGAFHKGHLPLTAQSFGAVYYGPLELQTGCSHNIHILIFICNVLLWILLLLGNQNCITCISDTDIMCPVFKKASSVR